MTVSIATLFSDIMTNITNNQQGSLQVLNPVNLDSGRVRRATGSIVLASQASGSVFGIARVPLFASLFSIIAITDTSLGSATIAFGDPASGNAAIYGAAATLTATNTPTAFAKTATYGVPITTGYDCLTGAATGYATDSGAGGAYEDIIMTTGSAALPASGNLRIVVEYMID
jgi:hypothetical protein